MANDQTLPTPDAIEIGEGSRHREQWSDAMQGIDRVTSVALSLKQPRTADWIAEHANVSATTARNHLERLVDLRVLSAVKKGRTKTYYPDADYQRFRTVSRFIEEHSQDELESIVVQAQEWIDELQATHGVERPNELRSKATEEGTSPADAKEFFDQASQWDEHRHVLSIAKEAIARYGAFERHDTHSPNETTV